VPLEDRVQAKILQEANLEKRTLHSLSPVAIQEDYYEVDHLSRRINKTRHRSAKRNRGAPPCFCYKTSSTTFYLQGPMHLSRTVTTRHRPHCPYSAMEQATAQLSVRLSTCILALRSKFEFALSFSHSAGRVSVSPGLICSRVVEDSPAFSLVRSIHLRIVQPRKRMAKQTGDQIVKELKKVFATRAAFIHDKLPDGRTLLDVSIDYNRASTCGRIIMRRYKRNFWMVASHGGSLALNMSTPYLSSSLKVNHWKY
jgi:hypothetical protein